MTLVLIGGAVSGVHAVVDVLVPADGLTVEETFPAEIIAAAIAAGDDVQRGWVTADGGKTFTAPPAPVAPPVDLAALKATLKIRVDGDAEALRLTLITPGSGQAMEYQEAYAEAVQVDAAVKANASATFDPAAYPMLAASLGFDADPITGKPTVDIPGEARAVLAAYDAYQRAGAAIRGARLKAKAAIESATAAVAAQAAYDAIAWPTFG